MNEWKINIKDNYHLIIITECTINGRECLSFIYLSRFNSSILYRIMENNIIKAIIKEGIPIKASIGPLLVAINHWVLLYIYRYNY